MVWLGAPSRPVGAHGSVGMPFVLFDEGTSMPIVVRMCLLWCRRGNNVEPWP